MNFFFLCGPNRTWIKFFERITPDGGELCMQSHVYLKGRSFYKKGSGLFLMSDSSIHFVSSQIHRSITATPFAREINVQNAADFHFVGNEFIPWPSSIRLDARISNQINVIWFSLSQQKKTTFRDYMVNFFNYYFFYYFFN